jgi:hypothetical protein
VNRKDFGGEIIPELGFSAGLWNGRKAGGQTASLAVTCGLAANNPHLMNSAALGFPSTLTYERNGALLDAVFENAIRAFEPDWAWVGMHELRELQIGQIPVFGIITFLSQHQFNVDVLALEALGAAVNQHELGLRVSVEPHIILSILDGLRNAIETAL